MPLVAGCDGASASSSTSMASSGASDGESVAASSDASRSREASSSDASRVVASVDGSSDVLIDALGAASSRIDGADVRGGSIDADGGVGVGVASEEIGALVEGACESSASLTAMPANTSTATSGMSEGRDFGFSDA